VSERRASSGGTCREVEPLIDELLDGNLDEARERAVRGHLRECLDCAARAEATRKLVDAAASLGPVDAPAALWAGLSARLDAEEIRFSQKPRWWWWWQAWQRRIVVAALVFAAAACGLIILATRPRPAAVASAPHARPVDLEQLYVEAVAKVERAGDDYASAVAELKTIVKDERGRWAPAAQAEYDHNLVDIEAAVERQRAAAHKAAGNPAAQDALAASYQREIEFLQEAVVRGPGWRR
jgi:putative zinc finger protein